MRKSILTALTLAFAVPAGAAIWQAGDVSRFFAASASSGDLLQGCTDVPEAVALATELRDRALRIERYMEAMDTRKAEIATAEAALRARATELRQQKSGIQSRRDGASQAVRADIDQPETGARIIAAVEPRQAALLTAQMGARSVQND